MSNECVPSSELPEANALSRLDVDNLSAELNLQASVASLVTINAGVQVGITKVNITISDVEAELELIIRLGNCKCFVQRRAEVFASFPLCPISDRFSHSGGYCESYHLESEP